MGNDIKCTERNLMGARELPEQLSINKDYEIQEALTLDGVSRILLSPSKCYLNDGVVELESVIEALIDRYNNHIEVNQPTLFQLHWQFDDRTEMIAQREIISQKELKDWVDEVGREHPLPAPEKVRWLLCNEKSKHFVMAVLK